ncbi:MAG: aromatic ring-hydroxylating dioxygenase subunit alpha [Phycisphaerales bacterium]|nr:aromatic ring-hydroxylating dioxygenase subunit alpha [Phycisphaerales bacterium]
MTEFHIDPDIRRAETIPSAVYTDPELFGASRERVFVRSWQLAADLDDVRVPGQVYPFTLLDGFVNEPLLLTRDRDDRLHCISNVCTHRANLVCEHPGVESGLRCRYHGRRFKLDGTFEHMPEFGDAENFPSDRDHLTKLPMERWGRLLFTGLRPTVAFSDWMGPVRDRMGWMALDTFRVDPRRCRDYLVQCNWALYCENYLEGFHIPYVHASLNAVLDYGAYRTELFEHGSLQVGVAAGGEHVFDLPKTSPDHGQFIAGYYFWLFPNLMLNFYPWGLSINVVRPLAVDRTRVSFLAYVGDESKLSDGAGAALDRVEREDEAIVEACQRGVGSRLYDRGRYSPTREQGTHHFHRLLAAALA